jgi:acetolactate synthase-1/2/3 large subunit
MAAATPRFGPVHLALPSDVARSEDRLGEATVDASIREPIPRPAEVVAPMAAALRKARRPIVVLGLDLNPHVDPPAVLKFVEQLRVPVFVTPKAKGMLPEDHPLFYGVCAGVSGDNVVVDFLGRSDLIVGIGFEPVESDKVWHHTMPLASIGPVSIALSGFRPVVEVLGDVPALLHELGRETFGPFDWPVNTRAEFRRALEAAIAPAVPPRGVSGVELTRRLRTLFPRNTILATDVGTVKMITTQAWASFEPLTFFESNGLSTMSYAFPAAMAARLQHPDRPVLCTIGDGGFSMTIAELETCVRERIHFVTVVFNDSSLSLIDSAQQRRGYPTLGVRYGHVDFAAASAGFGAWSRRVETLEELDAAVHEARQVDRPAVIDALVDPASYGIRR